MNRFFALVLALLFATLTVSSACVAEPVDWIDFTMRPDHGGSSKIDLRFTQSRSGNDHSSWSSDFLPSELVGFDSADFRRPGSRSLRFAVVREPGRLDCLGNGGGSFAGGNCRFTADAGFMNLLASRGIGRPTSDQAFGMMAVGVRRDMVDALYAAHYPTPTVQDLMALTAVGVTGRYIHAMASAGYRPLSVQRLIEFRAIGVTPEWIGGFSRIGYANIPQSELIQLRAMGITPDFIAGFDRIGYRHLPPTTLVQLRALDITPDFVRRAVMPRSALPTVDELIRLKTTGRWR